MISFSTLFFLFFSFFLSLVSVFFFFFFFNDTATTEIYTLSLHDALPISLCGRDISTTLRGFSTQVLSHKASRSEEHTSELQSLTNLVCRLLLEKKKTNIRIANKNKKINNEADVVVVPM